MERRKQVSSSSSYSSSSSLTSEIFGSKESSLSSTEIFGSIFEPPPKVLPASVPGCFFVMFYFSKNCRTKFVMYFSRLFNSFWTSLFLLRILVCRILLLAMRVKRNFKGVIIQGKTGLPLAA